MDHSSGDMVTGRNTINITVINGGCKSFPVVCMVIVRPKLQMSSYSNL